MSSHQDRDLRAPRTARETMMLDALRESEQEFAEMAREFKNGIWKHYASESAKRVRSVIQKVERDTQWSP